MRPAAEVHDALARLLRYPADGLLEELPDLRERLARGCPEAAACLPPFLEWLDGQSLGDLEEAYAATFDNTAERALEVGWHVFGESYTRGTFMVGLRGRLRQHGIPEEGELPDHLAHVLPLLGRAEPDWAACLARDSVLPTVEKIHAALVASASPWAPVLAAVQQVLTRHEPPRRAPAWTRVPCSTTPGAGPPPLAGTTGASAAPRERNDG